MISLLSNGKQLSLNERLEYLTPINARPVKTTYVYSNGYVYVVMVSHNSAYSNVRSKLCRLSSKSNCQLATGEFDYMSSIHLLHRSTSDGFNPRCYDNGRLYSLFWNTVFVKSITPIPKDPRMLHPIYVDRHVTISAYGCDGALAVKHASAFIKKIAHIMLLYREVLWSVGVRTNDDAIQLLYIELISGFNMWNC